MFVFLANFSYLNICFKQLFLIVNFEFHYIMYIFLVLKGARRGCTEGGTYGCNLKWIIDFGLGWFINIFIPSVLSFSY